MSNSYWVVTIAGGWNLLNGILHDVAVLRSPHGKQYDRNLLRLLMDGHILISSGVILLLTIVGIRSGNDYTYFIAMAVCLSMLVYCGMIFPFLKSFGTLFINGGALVFLIILFINHQ